MDQPRLNETVREPDFPQELQFRLNRLDTEIRTAFDVLNQRITWLMISSSFLLSAFISLEKSSPDIARHLRWLLPVLGVLSALLVGIAAVGKHRIIEHVKGLRTSAEAQASRFGCESLEEKTWPHRIINLPSQVLPWLLLLLWLFILGVQVVNAHTKGQTLDQPSASSPR
jgi:hypothetical protein